MMISENQITGGKSIICGVVVTYNPGESVLDNVTALLSQVGQVIIVDNGTQGRGKEYLVSLSRLSDVLIIYNGDNLGIAAALNIGVKWALSQGYEWVATLDQDSTVTPHMLSLMLDAYNAFPHKDRVALIAPRYRDQTTNVIITFAPRRYLDRAYAPIRTTMTSGNLVKATVFPRVGFYHEAMFIDLVDAEFCLRCGRQGYVILEAQNAWLDHNLGNPTKHKFLWKKVSVGNYSVVRRYYIARNRAWVYRKYFFMHTWGWIALDFYAFARECAGIILFEQDRREKIKATIRGIYHGLIGRLGPM